MDIKIPQKQVPDLKPVNLVLPIGSPSFPNNGDIIIGKPDILSSYANKGIGILTNLFGILLSQTESRVINNTEASVVIQNTRKDNPIQSFQDYEVSNSIKQSVFNSDSIFSPDAVPDGKGGYSPSPTAYWNGRLSSSTNQPVMTPITFIGTTYTSLSGKLITIPTITFEMVLITMSKGKNIEFTEITGRDTGSVKEYIGAKDWNIEIRAIIMASQPVAEGVEKFYQEGKYPEENMEKIDLLLDAPIAIKIDCPYINRRGINYIVINDGVEISQIEGEYEAQRLIIPCVSDNPLIIQTSTSV